MKGVTLFVLGTFIFGSSGYLIKVPTVPIQPTVGPVGWIHLQKLMLPLFDNVCEESTNPVIVRLSQEFSLDGLSGFYLKPEVTTNFESYKSKGFLPKGEIFTNYDFDHMNQLKVLYELFFYAKDFNTFFKAAAWARQNINCGLFVNAIYLAILNRRDTEKLSAPAPYELLPNYFIQKDVILKASALLSGEETDISETVRVEGNSYVLDANYTADFLENNYESKLAYFHEDIGLNCYYFLQKLKRVPWFNSASEIHMNYGEYLYHMIKQLNARYSLERYANNLPEPEAINYSGLKAEPYDPDLIYSNGNEFGYRTSTLEITDNEDLQLLQKIETNIATVVTHLRDTGYNKSDILNHLMGILITGERSFETILRNEIAKDATYSQPSVLEHYMTSLRDPVFWRLNKKIVDLVEEGLKVMPAYTRNELYFPGIEILNIDVKKIVTNFDYFQFDVTDALKTATTNTAFQVKIGQPRLNHKPFTVKLNISSLVSQKGFIKIYLGPKVSPGELTLKKNSFMLMDSFEYNFKMGTNVISRSSDEMKNLSGDFTSLKMFRKTIEDAEFGLSVAPFTNLESLSQFPSRLILPKGTPEGVPLQIFAFIAPFVKPTFGGVFSIPNMEFNSAILSPGYPLDLNIKDSELFDLPNAMIKDVVVTHKGDKVSNYDGVGPNNKWQKNNYDYTSPIDSSAPRKGTYDYKSKTGQYGKGADYGTKRKEPFKDDANITQYGKNKVNVNINTDDKTNSDEPTTSTSVNFEKEKNYDKDVITVNPTVIVRESEEYDIPELNNNVHFLQEEYTRVPSVYDYIRHDDYYDIKDPDNYVYEK